MEPYGLTEGLVEDVIALYIAAEVTLLERMARRLEKGIDTDHWAERQLLEIQRYRAEAQTVLEKLRADRTKIVRETVATAANRGTAAAMIELTPSLRAGVAGAGTIDVWSVTALAGELNRDFDIADSRILRSVDDIYRRVLASETAATITGTITRREAADRMFRKLAAQGITGFTDRAGRAWEMRAYVEAATRASVMNAAIEGHNARLQAGGHDLVIVTDVPQECELCRPYEGKILSLSGTDPKYPSLQSARDNGLYHPGCRHSHGAYFPGRTKPFGETADPEGDKARQKLRYLERRVRAAKREQLAALTPEGKKAAGDRVRAYQAKIREHVKTTTAKRQRHREQLNTAR